MKQVRAMLLVMLSALSLAGCTGVPDGVTPVKNFESQRYLGVWHEIVRLDNRFEHGLSDVTASYQPRADGGIDVLNKGFDPVKKVWQEAHGRAYFLDTPNVGSLKVSFFGPFYGGYHVIALDPDYRWAMVAGSSHDYFWVLARTPTLPDTVLAPLLQTARQAGFNLDDLIHVSQHRVQAADQ